MRNRTLAALAFIAPAMIALGALADAGLAAAEPAGKAADWLEYEWGKQFEELDRQIRTLGRWFRRVEATTYRAEALILEGDRDLAQVRVVVDADAGSGRAKPPAVVVMTG